jgi:soluble lytic murein transglycosylase-like protein
MHSAVAMCFEKAADTYGLSANLLRAIAQVESSMNPAAENRSHVERTGSYDIGLMQINSTHLPRLAQFGIDRDVLLRDPCTNVMVGAWLLADKLDRHGADWNGVGAYNAACTQLKGDDCIRARQRYSWRVFRAYERLARGGSNTEQVAAITAPAPSLRLLSLEAGD